MLLLTLEVGWVRLVSLSIGSTTYGFTTTLVTFITGLALGVYAATRLPFLLARPVASLFWLNAAIALWSAAVAARISARCRSTSRS